MELPWTEKYRPKTLDEVVGLEDIVERLKAYVKEKNMPNLLFAGPPGTGKTACALALSYELFGENLKYNFLELNASDERGIDIIRGKIKEFAATLPYGDASFKIIFLDEADALTRDAQNALRRTMEMYSRTTRFILSCNYSSKIIEPIQSRCALFRFKPLNKEKIVERLEYIAKNEGLHIDKKALDAVYYISEGDMRRAINILQAAAILEKHITEETIYKISAKARPTEIKELITLSLKGDFLKAREMLDKLLYEYGMSGEDIIIQIYKEVISLDIENKLKVKIIDRLGEINFRIVEGANDRIQLEALIAYLMILGTNGTNK